MELISMVVFLALFILSFYAISSIDFTKFCRVNNPSKVQVLMFLLSLCIAYISTQAILELTIYNGLLG